MNPYRLVALAQAEERRLACAYQVTLAARPLNVAAVWEARRAVERARQRVRQVQNRLETWRRLRWERLGPHLSPTEAGRRRLSWAAMRKALGDLGMLAIGMDAWLMALERLSRASRRARDRWSFTAVAAIHQRLSSSGEFRAELLRQPVENLVRLVQTLSPWATSLEQAEQALALWAEERQLEREVRNHPDQAA